MDGPYGQSNHFYVFVDQCISSNVNMRCEMNTRMNTHNNILISTEVEKKNAWKSIRTKQLKEKETKTQHSTALREQDRAGERKEMKYEKIEQVV